VLSAIVVSGSLQCGSDTDVAESPGSSDRTRTRRLDGVSTERGVSATTGPDSATIYTRRGRTYMREQAYGRAIKQLSQAVRLKPESPEAQDMLGLAHAFRLTPGKAIEHIEKAIELQPKNGNYHMHLGKAHMLLTDYAGAKVAYGRAIELGLKKGKPYYDLGIISEREGRLDDARTYYEKAVEVVPRFAPSCNLRLGIIAEKTGDDSGAVALYSAALKGNPTLTTAHYRIAQLYLKDGRESLAGKHLQKFRQQKAAAQRPETK
jgi:tetratricopeptide (TPR) repeat protein